MNLEHLGYFVEVARTEHVTRAARALAISPSAVSHAITKLEDELGHCLLNREGKRVVLTPEGRRFAVRAADLLRSVAELKSEVGTTRGWSGQYRLAGAHGLASEIATGWASITKQHTTLSAVLQSRWSDEIVQSVARAEIDFGVGCGRINHPDIEGETIALGHMILVARTGHPLSQEPPDTRASRLSGYQHVLLQEVTRFSCPFVDVHCGGRAPLVFDHYDVVARFIESSDAWAILPSWTLSLTTACLAHLVDLGPAPEASITAIWPRRRALAAPLLALRQTLERQLTQRVLTPTEHGGPLQT